jgi:hypothetical protein
MSTTIGRLAVALLGNIDDFKKNFGEAKKGVVGFQQTVQKTDVDLKKVGRSLTLIGTAMVGSLTAVTLATAKSAEEIDNLSKRTGVGREELQELAYAAKQEGASLEMLGTNLARLSRNMYDAANGTGEAKDAFKALNIDVRDAAGNLRNSDEILIEIANKFKGMPNDTERSALAMKLFGRAGADMIPFLRQGGDEIERLRKEARDLGFVLDEETIIQMEQLGDELEAVKTGFAGIGRQIAADTSPALLNLATGTKELFKWIHLIPDDIRQFITQGALMVGAVALIAGGLATLVTRISALKMALLALNTSFAPFLVGSAIVIGLTAIVGVFTKLKEEARLAKLEINEIKNVSDANAAIRFWENRVKDLQRQKEAILQDIVGIEQGRERAARSGIILPSAYNDQKLASDRALLDMITKQLTDSQNKLNAAIEKEKELSKTPKQIKAEQQAKSDYETQWTKKYFEATNQRIEALRLERDEELKKAKEVGASTKTLQKIRDVYAIREKEIADSMIDQSVFQNQAQAIDMISDAQQRLNQMLGVASPEWEEYARTLEKMAEKEGVLDVTAERLRMLAKAIRDAGANEAVRALEAEITSSVADSIKAGFEDGKASSVVDSFANYIKNKFYTNISQALADAFMKTQIGQWITNMIGGMSGVTTNTSIPGRAAGGSVTAGVLYKVNENPYAPEYFQSNESGKIIPLSQMGNQGTNVTVQVVNPPGMPLNAKQGQAKVTPEGIIIPVILNAVNNNTGGLADALAAAARAR